MKRALAVVSGSKHDQEVVREAGQLAGGVDAELFVLYVAREDTYERKQAAMASVPDVDTNYSIDNARDEARQIADDVGDMALGDVDVDWGPVGTLGEESDEILRTAEAYDVDHVFLAGSKRSTAGKAIFGDVTQDVILNFEGAVTVVNE